MPATGAGGRGRALYSDATTIASDSSATLKLGPCSLFAEADSTVLESTCELAQVASINVSLAALSSRAVTQMPNGRVGIGTSEPAVNLHVQAQGQHAEIRAEARTSGHPSLSVKNDEAEWSFGLVDSHGLAIRENSDQYATRIRVQNGGYVGIGTNAPKARLHVDGTVLMDGLFSRTLFVNSNSQTKVFTSAEATGAGKLSPRAPAPWTIPRRANRPRPPLGFRFVSECLLDTTLLRGVCNCAVTFFYFLTARSNSQANKARMSHGWATCHIVGGCSMGEIAESGPSSGVSIHTNNGAYSSLSAAPNGQLSLAIGNCEGGTWCLQLTNRHSHHFEVSVSLVGVTN